MDKWEDAYPGSDIDGNTVTGPLKIQFQCYHGTEGSRPTDYSKIANGSSKATNNYHSVKIPDRTSSLSADEEGRYYCEYGFKQEVKTGITETQFYNWRYVDPALSYWPENYEEFKEDTFPHYIYEGRDRSGRVRSWKVGHDAPPSGKDWSDYDQEVNQPVFQNFPVPSGSRGTTSIAVRCPVSDTSVCSSQ